MKARAAMGRGEMSLLIVTPGSIFTSTGEGEEERKSKKRIRGTSQKEVKKGRSVGVKMTITQSALHS